ncbi:MAG TPA: phosphoenolpyruvate synthase [Halieaceae bacterium]|nr:phosphoenolpyruvate synthase [Halieaceae bacterium]
MSKQGKDRRPVRWLSELGVDDVPLVGGKNASLGEMVSRLGAQGIAVPEGFATTADAFRDFIDANDLQEAIGEQVARYREDHGTLHEAGSAIRSLLATAPLPTALEAALRDAYAELAKRCGEDAPAVAVRSSATAEDLPDASFAGQQETFLNVRGADALVAACRRCFASLFTDRAISYREEKGFDHLAVALSVGVQRMVRSDCGASGVMFTIDTETGFPDAIVINAAWGLGETVVGGEVDPDEYTVFKPLLADAALRPILSRRVGDKALKAVYGDADEPVRRVATDERERGSRVLCDDDILALARMAVVIEAHYGRPMDIEWARDGLTGELYIVQARPETVQAARRAGVLTTHRLTERSRELARGLAVGDSIASGRVRLLRDPSEGADFRRGDVLVAAVTDPDWGPIMERAAAVVTDHGGRTAHAAIVSREIGIPAVVGTGNATAVLKDGDAVTVCCAEGAEGVVYEGILAHESEAVDLSDLPQTRTRIMLNIASPAGAFRWHALPCHGVGLARMEFIVASIIKVHPMALVRFDELDDAATKAEIEALTRGFDDKTEYFVDGLAAGIAQIAAAQYPDPVIIRMSDFKSNEYASLVGGAGFEPAEENPMIGVRGASRYYRDLYREGFQLECRAIRRVRETIGLDNVVVMIPFCRTTAEADKVLAVMAEAGLARGERGLKVYVMAEIPANVILAEAFAERFDGFSIGSNDLTQLTLGIDRDSSDLADLFDESNPAITAMIRALIERAHAAGRPVGLCGQAPSDHPEFAAFLVEAGIDSISLNPDSVVRVTQIVAEAEAAGEAPAAGPGGDAEAVGAVPAPG